MVLTDEQYLQGMINLILIMIFFGLTFDLVLAELYECNIENKDKFVLF